MAILRIDPPWVEFTYQQITKIESVRLDQIIRLNVKHDNGFELFVRFGERDHDCFYVSYDDYEQAKVDYRRIQRAVQEFVR